MSSERVLMRMWPWRGRAAGVRILCAALMVGLPLPGLLFPFPRSEATVAPPVVDFAFAGDVHFTEQVAGLLRAPANKRLQRVKALLAGADVAMVNFESAVTTRGTPAPKTYHFRAPASSLDALAAAGVDVVSMANNHAVDFGRIGLTDTLSSVQTRRAGRAPAVVGIGRSLREANSPAMLRVKGQRIAVFAATDIPDWTAAHHAAGTNKPGVNSTVRSDAALVEAVRRWRTRADIVVVFMHWGVEYTKCPSGSQRDIAARLVAAGADIVVGAHPHIQQGMGMKGRALVAYSLGNFIWFWNDRLDRASTGVLHVRMRGREVVSARWQPTRTRDSGEPELVTDSQRIRQVAADLKQRRGCADLTRPPRWQVR